jgi:hypothetical protein
MSDLGQTEPKVGHDPDDPRCEMCIDRVITRVRSWKRSTQTTAT